ncbi:YbaB/EbfC family nucleoid-associated protein [Lentzea sp. PSKA42]|uniref:YbaB/EbfC family nucleoid-associated protein n=1 Tax=Lentzea indica TaxID=2604800 RepID=A0ABX1FLT1_9PSEU|nr:YbaB/EbfC family nucleoid-associated protein [Lentzea indica]NKE59734.1 YbaB/EbfC family nucleoid-associated protein [Lentzea indica]
MNALDEIEAAVQKSAARQQQLAQAQAEVAERRFTDEIPDVVRVTVNGTGDVLEIELAAGCLDTGRQPHLLGERITRAVGNARRQSALAARDALSEVLGEQVAHWLVGDEEPKPERRSPRNRPGDKGTEDYFEDKDAKGFLEEQPWLP